MNKETISKLLIVFLYEVDYKIISCRKEDDYFICKYHNEQEQLIDSKIRFTEKGIEWGNLFGRWRNDGKDAKITYKVYGNEVKFTEEYPGGRKLIKKLKP